MGARSPAPGYTPTCHLSGLTIGNCEGFPWQVSQGHCPPRSRLGDSRARQRLRGAVVKVLALPGQSSSFAYLYPRVILSETLDQGPLPVSLPRSPYKGRCENPHYAARTSPFPAPSHTRTHTSWAITPLEPFIWGSLPSEKILTLVLTPDNAPFPGENGTGGAGPSSSYRLACALTGSDLSLSPYGFNRLLRHRQLSSPCPAQLTS